MLPEEWKDTTLEVLQESHARIDEAVVMLHVELFGYPPDEYESLANVLGRSLGVLRLRDATGADSSSGTHSGARQWVDTLLSERAIVIARLEERLGSGTGEGVADILSWCTFSSPE